VQQTISGGQVKAALAAYFAIIGALSPYLGLYLDSLGLAASQIALLLALPQATRIFAPPMWGWLADHYRKPALILQVSAVVMVLSVTLLPFAKASVVGIGAVLLLFYIFSAAQMPLSKPMPLRLPKVMREFMAICECGGRSVLLLPYWCSAQCWMRLVIKAYP
jgi:MFS family permease